MKITINVPETAHGVEIIESIAFHGGLHVHRGFDLPVRPVTIETIDFDG